MEGEQTWPTEEELQEAAGVINFLASGMCTCVLCVCTYVGVCVTCYVWECMRVDTCTH